MFSQITHVLKSNSKFWGGLIALFLVLGVATHLAAGQQNAEVNWVVFVTAVLGKAFVTFNLIIGYGFARRDQELSFQLTFSRFKSVFIRTCFYSLKAIVINAAACLCLLVPGLLLYFGFHFVTQTTLIDPKQPSPLRVSIEVAKRNWYWVVGLGVLNTMVYMVDTEKILFAFGLEVYSLGFLLVLSEIYVRTSENHPDILKDEEEMQSVGSYLLGILGYLLLFFLVLAIIVGVLAGLAAIPWVYEFLKNSGIELPQINPPPLD